MWRAVRVSRLSRTQCVIKQSVGLLQQYVSQRDTLKRSRPTQGFTPCVSCDTLLVFRACLCAACSAGTRISGLLLGRANLRCCLDQLEHLLRMGDDRSMA